MSLGPRGRLGAAAGSPLSQSPGTDVQQSQQNASDPARRTQSDNQAEQASGVGQTEHDEEASDRDADGRRPWELGACPSGDAGQAETDAANDRPSKDPSGTRGGRLDISG